MSIIQDKEFLDIRGVDILTQVIYKHIEDNYVHKTRHSDTVTTLVNNIDEHNVNPSAHVDIRAEINANAAKAKEYTDTVIEPILPAAKVYSDDNDAKTLAAANSYTDEAIAGKVVDVNKYSDDNDTIVLANAKKYTDDEIVKHNAAADTHQDIRNSISNLNNIKVDIVDIIDNLETESADKPLSANQGVVLKKAIDTKAPINHTSQNTIYGQANDTLYGHVKLSDDIDNESDVNDGIAATPKAIKQIHDLIDSVNGDVGDHIHTVTHTPIGTVSTPIFTGSEVITGNPLSEEVVASREHTHKVIAAGSISSEFTGNKATISTKYTPAGNVASEFTGTEVTSGSPSSSTDVASPNHIHKVTAAGVINSGFTGTEATISTKYTPAGINSAPEFSGIEVVSKAPSNAVSINSVTNVGTIPTLTSSVNKKRLTLTFNSGTTPSIQAVNVATNGHTHRVTAAGINTAPIFAGTEATISTKYTPAGNVASEFTGTEVTSGNPSETIKVANDGHTHKVTASGNIASEFTGNETTISTEYIPEGIVNSQFNGTEVVSNNPSSSTTVASRTHAHKVTGAGTISAPDFIGVTSIINTSKATK